MAPNAANFAPKQIDHGTDGPPTPENMCSEGLLRTTFGDTTILHLRWHASVIHEGSDYDGISALVDLVAERPEPRSGRSRPSTI